MGSAVDKKGLSFLSCARLIIASGLAIKAVSIYSRGSVSLLLLIDDLDLGGRL